MSGEQNESYSDDAIELAEGLVGALASMTVGAVLQEIGHFTDPGEVPHPLPDLRNALVAHGAEHGIQDARVGLVDWDRAEEISPSVGDEDGNGSMPTVFASAVFYTRLMCRVVPRDPFGEKDRDVFAQDGALLGFLKVLVKVLPIVGIRSGFFGFIPFTKDFVDHGTNMAMMAGTLSPAGEDGFYRTTLEHTDALRGPWGLSKEAWLQMDFPHGEEIYDILMEQVRAADSCLIG